MLGAQSKPSADPMDAYIMATYSELAYAHPEHAELYFQGSGDFYRYLSDPAIGIQCHVGSFEHGNVLAFRGSQATEMVDWLTNTKFRRVRGPFADGDRVHRGFLASVDTIWNELIDVLVDVTARYPNKPLYITGHSKGAAEATITAARLAKAGWVGLIVYTFGSPRVGNWNFKEIYNYAVPQTFRYCHSNDIVTRIPWLIGTYQHVGQHYYIDRHLKIHENPSLLYYYLMRWGSLSSGLFSWATNSVLDHSMSNYVAATVHKMNHIT